MDSLKCPDRLIKSIYTFNSIEWIPVYRSWRTHFEDVDLSIPLNGFRPAPSNAVADAVRMPFNSIEWIL